MPIIELSNYAIEASSGGEGIEAPSFTLSRGDVCQVQTDQAETAHLFLKALATLRRPWRGTYRFNGQPVDFSNYRNLLPFKHKIGYVARDAVLIANRSVRENMLFTRYYFENSLSLNLDADDRTLCSLFKFERCLDKRPSELDQLELKIAVTIRELMKSPDVLLIEFPEELIRGRRGAWVSEALETIFKSARSVVFFSYRPNLVTHLITQNVSIHNGTATVS